MNGDRCQQKGCTGTFFDGYCDVCGHAEPRSGTANVPTSPIAAREGNVPSNGRSAITTGTGSTPASRAARGSRRTGRTGSHSSRKQLGAGLITLPDLPSTDPEKAVIAEPSVPERKRFCPKCESPLKREIGFCGKCGQKYSFIPSLKRGDIVAGQYDVKGVLAYGGLGWIYLGFDNALSRYVVLKGLLNANDAASAATALAERQFLAAVKHSNIVGVYNFVQQGPEGFIVMEYIGGQTLKQIRQDRGPLPPAEAIAYIHRILSAFAYLHQRGLVYCDFKPENVMLERDDVKLIDMGGVRRIDDQAGDIYGTAGYSAPEAGSGPTVQSDLFTVGRTLAVLLTEIKDFTSRHRYSLPSPEEEPLLAKQESLYRFLLRATAFKADDRFESATDMAEQLLGVMREVVALESGTPRPGQSLWFGVDQLGLESGHEMQPVAPDRHHLPAPLPDLSDPAIQFLTNASGTLDPGRRLAALRQVVQKIPSSREARLRVAALHMDVGAFADADSVLNGLEQEDAWDWRVLWTRAMLRLAQNRPKDAQELFDQVYFDLPGEIAPKLALALSAELAGNIGLAAKMYDLVSRTDPGYVSASFGLARCLRKQADRQGSAQALDRVPQSSALFLRARVEQARTWIGRNHVAPGAEELTRASAALEAAELEGPHRFELGSQILETALDLLLKRAIKPDKKTTVFGEPMVEERLRASLEKNLRAMARLAAGDARIALIDRANRVRPRSWF